MTTIREIALAAGVTKQAIRRRAVQLFGSDLPKVEGIISFTEAQAAEILSVYTGNSGSNVGSNITGTVTSNDTGNIVSTLREHIVFLQQQVVEKDRQLTSKDEQITQLTAALDNALKINAVQAASIKHLGDGTEHKPWWRRIF